MRTIHFRSNMAKRAFIARNGIRQHEINKQGPAFIRGTFPAWFLKSPLVYSITESKAGQDSNLTEIPCQCGNRGAYWGDYANGTRREYACHECHKAMEVTP